MENQEIAKIFWEIAELLELKGGNRFKVRAYQKAARNLESIPQNLEAIYKQGGLKALEEIPGIGLHMAEKIEEQIRTGKISRYTQLLKQFPPGFTKLLEIPNVGPKTALLLLEKLKIKSIKDLDNAIAKGRLKDLPGFKEKKVQNIMAGIKLKQTVQGRFLLSEAYNYAQALIKELKQMKELDQIVPAGSLRRWQETIGDIDLLAITKKPKDVMQKFLSLPQIARVLSHGPTKSTVILSNNMQCDLRVLSPETFGSALHYFTGDKQHNIQIRERAIKLGLKISEYGVFKGPKRIGGKTEEEVFRAVGLPFIPPELRTGSGEIEAAEAGQLPNLIELSDIRGDLHLHTNYSDGSNSIEEMAEAAKQKGYEYIAVTDHSFSTRIAGGQNSKDFVHQMKVIDKLNFKGIRVLKGVEVDILADGALDFKDEILKETEIVVASIHSRFKMTKKEMTRRIVQALKNKYVTIFSHPTGRLIGQRPPYEVEMEDIIKVAADTGTYLELNSHPSRLDLKDIHCRRAKQLGAKIAINTDAHMTSHLDYMRYGIATARRGWLEKGDVLNALPLKTFLKKISRKRR